ncbi:MAG: flavodoxin domain-containing protein [Candidatus Neomarinimicrobiota bacterium]
MQTLIVYATKHGCTENCAESLARRLTGDVKTVNLKKNKLPDLDGFETIIVGGSIHAGRVQGIIKRFCQNHHDRLMEKRLGLFLCCMEEGDKAQAQFDLAFPGDLRAHAVVKGLFGGVIDFQKMNWLEKTIMKKIAKTDQNITNIKESEIDRFTQSILKI